jgi:hypothetical protein
LLPVFRNLSPLRSKSSVITGAHLEKRNGGGEGKVFLSDPIVN